MPDRIKPTQKPVKAYYARIVEFREHGVTHEGAVSAAFQELLEATTPRGWRLVPQDTYPRSTGHPIRPDGTVWDDWEQRRGFWEAKDADDDLDAEIGKKRKAGYPLTNIIFEDTERAVLYQNNGEAMRVMLDDAAALCDLLNRFYDHTEPHIEDFHRAVEEFKERVPDLAKGLVAKIVEAHDTNDDFQAAFEQFYRLCSPSLNPNISRDAVDEMLVQHLLTERLIRTVFDRDDFVQRNVIAAEIENVIEALVSQSFSRKEFLKSLDRFYLAIENDAEQITDWNEKQHFINTVYERFFQGYSVKIADTHGIVYTPQPIVDFMCASVEEVLRTEFDTDLGGSDVCIIDPCTGTGNFIVNLMGRVPKEKLADLYRNRLFANEVMLLPYYIAALNIEHRHYELTGQYEPFEGLCFVDTLDLAEGRQAELAFMTEKNTERVEKQKAAPITVVIGNPPYNAHQVNENDNSKNRKYPVIDDRVRETYVKDSDATLSAQLYDPYVKFFRWATDRLGNRDGIVCFVSNNSFVDQNAFDGMRKHFADDFTRIYHVDLHGNVRQNPKLSGTTHNVFGIQVGVGITVAVRRKAHDDRAISYHRVEENWRREEKCAWLARASDVSGAEWEKLEPDDRHTWLVPEDAEEFAGFVPIGSKHTRNRWDAKSMFGMYCRGVASNGDTYVYDFSRHILAQRTEAMVEDFNTQLDRWLRNGSPRDLDGFLTVNEELHKWIRNTKRVFLRGTHQDWSETFLRRSPYRPFSLRWHFFHSAFNEDLYHLPKFLPLTVSHDNILICARAPGATKEFHCLATDSTPDFHFTGDTQSFPFYVYDEDGSNRRENVTDWSLQQFREHYGDASIEKWDIFWYVYGVLHHPGYRQKFADNLKKELPRIPYAPDFRAFADAGKQLGEWHLGYEDVEPWKLDYEWADDVPMSWRVERMKLSRDKRSVIYNESLTLRGVPEDVFEYRLGNRSALEWVIDQYRVKTDKRSGITHDPNSYGDDEQYIVKLVGRVIRVSMETVKIVRGIAELPYTGE